MGWSVGVSSPNNVVKSNFEIKSRGVIERPFQDDRSIHLNDCSIHLKRISGYTAVFFKIVMDEQSSLLALFTSSFLAATLLPGGSEAVLFGVLTAYPQLYWPALAVASVGNTLGGMS